MSNPALHLPERVKYELESIVHNCLHHKASWYLLDRCISDMAISISDMANASEVISAPLKSSDMLALYK